MADPALVPLWFIAREAHRHVPVVLSGEGADEPFGGYAIYREPHALAPFDRLPDPPARAWLREEMHGWARDVVRDSGADHLVDLGAARRMLEAHRTGPVDHSRRIWALLVFLIWHGVCVEERIRPAIPAVVRGARAR